MTAPTMITETGARNADLGDLATLLKDHRVRSVDVVAPAGQLASTDGNLVIAGTEPELTEDGVTTTDGWYTPTSVADEGIASKLGVPIAYLRRMRGYATDLYDANVNGWLRRDNRSFLVRCLRSDTGSVGSNGIVRAFLSDQYKVIDNLDVLLATLNGIRQAGVEVNIDGCDLTDRRMYVRVTCPQVAELAPDLLRRYRSPFTGASGADNPTVFAGFVISNSETGCGAFSITPRLVVQVCSNGMTMTKDALRAVHLGARMDDGVVRWSAETQDKNLALVTSQARDAVATFLDVDYVRRAIARVTEQAGAPVEHVDTAVKVATKRLGFTEDQGNTILDHFIKGGDTTIGGLYHAVTSTAQTALDADSAYDLEARAAGVFELAGSI